jgi:hypothetical protein
MFRGEKERKTDVRINLITIGESSVNKKILNKEVSIV